MANYSIDILSISFRCHHCSGSLKNWIIYLTAEGLPPLIFFSVVLILHISFTNGPLNGFIFFSQMITVSIEIILLQTSWMDTPIRNSNILTGFIIRVYSVWSLEFLRLAHGHYSFCLGSNLKVMHILVLRYLSVAYPLCFLIVAFIVIELHARNCHLLVWLWKPLCIPVCKIQTGVEGKDIYRRCLCSIHSSFICETCSNINSPCHLHKITVHNSNYTIKTMNYDPTVIPEYRAYSILVGCRSTFAYFWTCSSIPPHLLPVQMFPEVLEQVQVEWKWSQNLHGCLSRLL